MLRAKRSVVANLGLAIALCFESLLIVPALGAAALAGAAAETDSRSLEQNSIKRYMFTCGTVAEIKTAMEKRELSLTQEIPSPRPGKTAIFEGSYKNGLKNPYVVENIGGKYHVYIELRRPQFPVPPLPYFEQEVVFDNDDAGISFVGTLSYPSKGGPFGAAVLIHGSGAHTRDEMVSLHKIFLVLADHLTRQGIAVLRYDKRGVGLSGGKPDPQSTSDDYASDVRAAVCFLKIQPNIDPSKIGLIGHSEGGFIAPMVAADSADVAFIVLLAGTGLPGMDIQMLQENAMGKARGSNEKAVIANDKLNKVVFPIIIATKDNGEALRRIRAAEKEVLTAEERKLLGFPDQGFPDEVYDPLLSPWFRRFLELDPRAYLEKVKCPVLALNGEKDLQVLPDPNLAEIEKALRKGGNQNVTVNKLQGINHMFQTAPTGLGIEYRNIEETFAPAALEIISTWIRKVVGTAS